MSSQVPPQQSVPAARAPVLQPCPGQTLCPASCLGKDESTGVHPVPLGCTLCLPLPMMAISFLTGRDSGAQGGEWSLAALLRGKVVPDCVGATPAPLLPQCRAPETIHICHGNHGGLQGPREGECKLGTVLSIPAPGPTRTRTHPPAPTASQGCAGGWQEAGQTDPGGALLCRPPTAPLASAAAFPRQPRGVRWPLQGLTSRRSGRGRTGPGCAGCLEEALRRCCPSAKPVSPAPCHP